MQFRWSLRTCLVLCLALVACRSAGRAPKPDAGPTRAAKPSLADPSGFNLVVVTDVSQSMTSNDRDGFNRQGAQLAVALADVTDNLGLVAFNSGIEEVLPLTAMSSVDRRKDFDRKIDALENRRSTNYLRALTEAEKLLTGPGIGKKSAIIFLSDGDHDPKGIGTFLGEGDYAEDKAELRKRSDALGSKECSLYTIAFTDEVGQLMKDMAVGAGGAYYSVTEPSDLLDAYLEVLGDVYELFQYTKDPSQLKVDKLTRRLVYVLIKNGRQSTASLMGKISRDGQTVDLDTAAYRRTPRRQDSFDVVQFTGNVTGEWSCSSTSAEGRVVLLSQVPISFRIVPGSPEYPEKGEQVFEIEAICPDDEMAGYAENLVSVQVHSEAGGTSSDPIQLTPRREGTKVIFRGTGYARRLNPVGDEAEQQDVMFLITLGNGGWTHTKQRTTRIVVPVTPLPDPPKKALSLTYNGREAQSIDLGRYWAAEVGLDQSFLVKNTHSAPVNISFKGTGLVAPPADLELAAGEEQTVQLRPRAAQTSPGLHRGELTLTCTPLSGNAELEPQTVAMSLTVYGLTLSAPRGSTLAPGNTKSISVGVKIQPEGVPMQLSVSETAKVDGLALGPWTEQVQGSSFEVSATASAVSPGGKYSASLSFTPEGTNLPPRSFPFELEVSSSRPTLKLSAESLNLTVPASAWTVGDAKFEFKGALDITMTHFATLQGTTGFAEDLKGENGAVLRGLDVQTWIDPPKLEPGRPAHLTIQVNLNDNVSPGIYTGPLTVGAVLAGRDRVLLEIPVTIEVKR